jgi:hypothetical protein
VNGVLGVTLLRMTLLGRKYGMVWLFVFFGLPRERYARCPDPPLYGLTHICLTPE